MQWASMEFFRERRSSFSLEIHAIGLLDFDGARRENVLRAASYAWTPAPRGRSFSLLAFYSHFYGFFDVSVSLRPFDRSQNMGPNCGNFFEIFGLAVTAQKLKWAVCVEFGIKMHA